MAATPSRTTARPRPARPPARVARRRPRLSARRRRGLRRLAGALGALASLTLAVLLVRSDIQALQPPIESGPDLISAGPEPAATEWSGPQPDNGIDVSFPQCGRTLRDLDGFVIVGLDGGMPDRANPCFARQWGFARRQAGAAVYVNTADTGRGDPERLGRRTGQADVKALRDHGIAPGTPVWLDVELPRVWRGSPARHRAVLTAHLRALARAGYPVGLYSAPALWREITGGAPVDVPTWVGIGRATRERAAATCRRRAFGGVRPSIVQRIGTGSDGRPLDRNLVCPGVDLTGLVGPA